MEYCYYYKNVLLEGSLLLVINYLKFKMLSIFINQNNYCHDYINFVKINFKFKNIILDF
jgi:hypothetical protein